MGAKRFALCPAGCALHEQHELPSDLRDAEGSYVLLSGEQDDMARKPLGDGSLVVEFASDSPPAESGCGQSGAGHAAQPREKQAGEDQEAGQGGRLATSQVNGRHRILVFPRRAA